METKKLSRTVRRRLNKKGIIIAAKLQEHSSSATTSKQQSEKKTEIVEMLSEAEKSPTTTELPVASIVVAGKRNVNKPTVLTTTAEVASIVVAGKRNVNKPTVLTTTADESKPKNSPKTIAATLNKPNRRRNPRSKVVYINSNYGRSSIGGLIQNELVGLRNQSENIKSASDLTESQAHVIKRQITRLQSNDEPKTFKRPKHYDKTVGEATKELKLILEAHKATKRRTNK